MIQDINPHKFDLTYGQPKAQDEDFVLYIKKSKTLLRKVDEENHKIPKFSDFPEDKGAAERKRVLSVRHRWKSLLLCDGDAEI